jgi:hypothetical protein
VLLLCAKGCGQSAAIINPIERRGDGGCGPQKMSFAVSDSSSHSRLYKWAAISADIEADDATSVACSINLAADTTRDIRRSDSERFNNSRTTII